MVDFRPQVVRNVNGVSLVSHKGFLTQQDENGTFGVNNYTCNRQTRKVVEDYWVVEIPLYITDVLLCGSRGCLSRHRSLLIFHWKDQMVVCRE